MPDFRATQNPAKALRCRGYVAIKVRKSPTRFHEEPVFFAPGIIAAQFVTPFRKGRKIENGQADVGSTATATRQNNIRFMPAKSSNRQGRLPSHRVREAWNVEARVMGRRISGLLAELG